MRGSRSRSSESGIAVAVTSQIGESLSSESSTEGDARKVAEPNKESSHSSTSGSKRDNEDDNSRKAEIGAGKRPRTGERALPILFCAIKPVVKARKSWIFMIKSMLSLMLSLL